MKRMQKGLALLLFTVFLSALLFGCGEEQTTSSTSSGGGGGDSSQTASTGETQTDAALDVDFTARDLDVGYDESTATRVTLSGDSIVVSGAGASASGSVLTITEEGVYLLTGSLDNGQIVVDAADTAKIQIVFDNVSIHCEEHAPLFIRQADKVFLTLAEGSENTLTDGESYVLPDEDSNVDGVIFSRADLTINGGGALNITASYKHGIVSKDDLVITGGSISVTAAGGGLYGKDCVKIADGVFILNTQTDGIQSSNAEEAGRGYVYICSGRFTITAGTDGIQAETALLIDGGEYTITTGGGSANASMNSSGEVRPGWGQWGPETAAVQTDDSADASAKGLKAGTSLTVNEGVFTIDSSDDSLHSNGDLTLTGGTFDIASGDDGMHADSSLMISGGTVGITKSYEGIEGMTVTISGGTISLTASDDGVNSAGGSDGSSLNGRPGQNGFAAVNTDCFVSITGGVLTIDASGDGIDSNGSLTVSGGEVYINGPTDSGNGALDCEGEASVSGGVVVAAGSAGMRWDFRKILPSARCCTIGPPPSQAARPSPSATKAETWSCPIRRKRAFSRWCSALRSSCRGRPIASPAAVRQWKSPSHRSLLPMVEAAWAV